MRKILAVGAIDRDNFGDLLFYIVTKHYISNEHDIDVVPSGISYTCMCDLLGEDVVPYTTAIKDETWDAIMVIGGEVGAVSVEDGYRMLLSKEQSAIYDTQTPKIKQLMRQTRIYNDELMASAYIPYINSDKQLFVLNSVGLSRMDYLNDDSKKRVVEGLRKAVKVVVRDVQSEHKLEEHGIKAEVAPDAVHVIKKVYGSIRRPKGLPKKYIAVQMSASFIESRKPEDIAKVLDALTNDYSCDIVFFAAGTANHHDSFELYESIAETMRASATIYYERTPISIVECISNSMLSIGTSLHVRIVSAAYSIPRISLVNEKVSEYSEHWDNSFPHGVDFSDLQNGVKQALAVDVEQLNNIAAKLEQEADKSMQQIIGTVAGRD